MERRLLDHLIAGALVVGVLLALDALGVVRVW